MLPELGQKVKENHLIFQRERKAGKNLQRPEVMGGKGRLCLYFWLFFFFFFSGVWEDTSSFVNYHIRLSHLTSLSFSINKHILWLIFQCMSKIKFN